jgi:hypothetical protein
MAGRGDLTNSLASTSPRAASINRKQLLKGLYVASEEDIRWGRDGFGEPESTTGTAILRVVEADSIEENTQTYKPWLTAPQCSTESVG